MSEVPLWVGRYPKRLGVGERCSLVFCHDLMHLPIRISSLSDTIHLLISFRKATPPQNRQLNILISNAKQQVDDCVGELTFQNLLINTFCEMISAAGKSGFSAVKV